MLVDLAVGEAAVAFADTAAVPSAFAGIALALMCPEQHDHTDDLAAGRAHQVGGAYCPYSCANSPWMGVHPVPELVGTELVLARVIVEVIVQ